MTRTGKASSNFLYKSFIIKELYYNIFLFHFFLSGGPCFILNTTPRLRKVHIFSVQRGLHEAIFLLNYLKTLNSSLNEARLTFYIYAMFSKSLISVIVLSSLYLIKHCCKYTLGIIFAYQLNKLHI